MKKVLLVLAVLFSFSAVSFAKTTPVKKGTDLKAQVTAAIAKENKALAGNATLIDQVTADLQKEIKKYENQPGDHKINLKKTYNVDGQAICIDIYHFEYEYLEIGEDYIYYEYYSETWVFIYEC